MCLWNYVCYNTQQQQLFYGPLSRTTRVSRYQKKHSPSWSFNLYQLLLSTTIHSILSVQITCLAIFYHNLFPCPLWSNSWSGALHLIFHTFLHSISVFFSQHMPIPLQPVAVVSILYHLYLVFLSTPYLELYLQQLRRPVFCSCRTTSVEHVASTATPLWQSRTV